MDHNRNRLHKTDAFIAGIALAVLVAASLACVSGEKGAGDSTSEINAVITGTVTAGGAAVSGARVAVDRGDFQTTTNASGQYTLHVYGGRTYNVFATLNGYRTEVVQGVRPPANSSITTNLSLTTPLASGERTYVGSSACKLCHATQYNLWQNAAHRHALTSPGDSPGMLSAINDTFGAGLDLSTVDDFATYGSNAPKFSRSGDTWTVTIGNVAYPVHYTIGYQWKQRFITRIGNAHYILPVQYNRATGEWVTYNASDWYNGTTPRYTSQAEIETDVYKKNSWERKCMGCHSVTGILDLSFGNGNSGIRQHLATFVEKGVGCEACHGPASAHVWGNGAIGSATDPYVVNPKNLSRGRQLDLCGSCHSRGVSWGRLGGLPGDTYTLEYYYDSALERTFRPGDTLARGYQQNPRFWSDTVAEVRSSKSHHQQWNDLWQSAHLAPGAADTTITCGSCHNSHGNVAGNRQVLLSAEDNSLCLTCHGLGGRANQRFATDTAVTAHVGIKHHEDVRYDPGGTGMGRCITCHMPYTAKSALNYDIRSHTFRVLRPHNTRRSYNAALADTMPNSCQQACHYSGASLGPDFGSGSAGALAAAQAYDSNVGRNGFTDADSATAKVSGTITLGGAQPTGDSVGTWITIDHTDRSCATNDSGQYALILDVPGTYTIRITRTGFLPIGATIVLTADSVFNADLAVSPGSDSKVMRCGACHGGIWGAEWRRSGTEGLQATEHNEEAAGVETLEAGHGKIAGTLSSPTGSSSGCPKCHESRPASTYLRGSDTTATGATLIQGVGSRRGQTCQVCHTNHGETTTVHHLAAYRPTDFDTGFFYANNNGPDSSPAFPAPYEATACIMCHNQRTAARNDGTGIKPSGSDSVAVSTPHVGNNAEGFFGFLNRTTGASVNFDSFPPYPDTMRASSRHADSWGTQISYQAFEYSNGAPLLVYTSSGAPDAVLNERFTCVTCHMWQQEPGTIGGGTRTAHDAGHTWKPDIQACAVCHDPAYVSLNPYTNNMRAGSAGAGDVGFWGTDSWGVSSAGVFLGFDRPVDQLAHTNDSGTTFADTDGSRDHGDGVVNDYDGDGVAEGAHTEAKHLFERVEAALTSGTVNGLTSGIGTSGTDSFGHVLLSGYPYWRFYKNDTAAAATLDVYDSDVTRAAWNLVFFEHDESNLGQHNLRFTINTLRATWTVLGRKRLNNPNWVPPGDDY